jgi:hypothetical protein
LSAYATTPHRATTKELSYGFPEPTAMKNLHQLNRAKRFFLVRTNTPAYPTILSNLAEASSNFLATSSKKSFFADSSQRLMKFLHLHFVPRLNFVAMHSFVIGSTQTSDLVFYATAESVP